MTKEIKTWQLEMLTFYAFYKITKKQHCTSKITIGTIQQELISFCGLCHFYRCQHVTT